MVRIDDLAFYRRPAFFRLTNAGALSINATRTAKTSKERPSALQRKGFVSLLGLGVYNPEPSAKV
jgi:hypothetical protein